MSLLLLLLLTLACLPIEWQPPMFGIGPTGSAALTGGIVAALLLVARLFTIATIHRITSDTHDREAASRAHGLRRLVFFFLNLGGFAIAMICCGWAWTVHETLTFNGKYMAGAELIVLAPYLITMIGSWAIFYDAERLLHLTSSNPALRCEFWTRGGYVLFLLRHHMLMVFMPVMLMVVQLGVVRSFPEMLESVWTKIAAFVCLFLFILTIPSLVPLVLGLRPMPDCRLRDRLVAAADRLGVRYRNLYVWETRGNIATAMVTGLIPRFRQIVFTDLLLATLTEDEIEAVFGHEVGHVRHGHLLYYAGFLLLSFLTLGVVYHSIESLAGSELLKSNKMLVSTVIATGCYLFLVFGFISRRCERQADVFGCKSVSCADPECTGHGPDTVLVAHGQAICPSGVGTFVRALERVEDVNGAARGSTRSTQSGLIARLGGLLRLVGVCLATWQHSTIAKRVEFLKSLAEDPHRERQFQRRVTILRWGLLLALVAGVVGVLCLSGWEEFLQSM
jgi:Zn-dependent protease with chaperone function